MNAILRRTNVDPIPSGTEHLSKVFIARLEHEKQSLLEVEIVCEHKLTTTVKLKLISTVPQCHPFHASSYMVPSASHRLVGATLPSFVSRSVCPAGEHGVR